MSDDIEDSSEDTSALRARVMRETSPEGLLRAELKGLLVGSESATMPSAGDTTLDEATADACPHCDPTHRDPASRPWGVYVAPACDADGQPEYLIVRPSNGAHVAESDATWLWELIRNA